MCYGRGSFLLSKIFLTGVMLITSCFSSVASCGAFVCSASGGSSLAVKLLSDTSINIPETVEHQRVQFARAELFQVVFHLYRSIALEKRSLKESLENLRHMPGLPAGIIGSLLSIDISRIRYDEHEDVLYIPYKGNVEIRIFSREKYPEGLPVSPGRKLFERGTSDSYMMEILSSATQNPHAKEIALDDEWLDELARIASFPALSEHCGSSARQRDILNEGMCYVKAYEESILPALKNKAQDLRSQGRPVVLTLGITGSAASGKTSVAEEIKEWISEEFDNVRMIYFDDWLLESADREIDPETGKTTEDVFKKFEVDHFVRSMKAFISGQDLLKPVYNQTAKGSVKILLDDEGSVRIRFGPKREIVIDEKGRDTGLEVMDDAGRSIERGNSVSVFGMQFSVMRHEDGKGIQLRMLDTSMEITALDENGNRRITILDENGMPARDLKDITTGEILAESGAVLVEGGYIDGEGVFVSGSWKAREFIPHTDGVYMVEGIMALHDTPDEDHDAVLAELYTTTVFVDVDFAIRLARGLGREKLRYEEQMGKPMPAETAENYVRKFTQRKEVHEDPFIYLAEDVAEHKTTTRNRAEAIFSLYRRGRLFSGKFSEIFHEMAVSPRDIEAELARIESDFVFRKLREFSPSGELQYEREVKGKVYDVYHLREGMVIKAPKTVKAARFMKRLEELRNTAGDIMVPAMSFDASELNIKIEGKSPRTLFVQNEVRPLHHILESSSYGIARESVDKFLELQQKMWIRGFYDPAVNVDRYGIMVNDKGKLASLFFAMDELGTDPSGFDGEKLMAASSQFPEFIREYYTARAQEVLLSMTREDFKRETEENIVLSRFQHPEITLAQLGYLTSVTIDESSSRLWRYFKQLNLPEAIMPEIVWTRLWIDCMTQYSPRVENTLSEFYEKLVSDPAPLAAMSTDRLLEFIVGMGDISMRSDFYHISRFVTYFARLSLEMKSIGSEEGALSSTLRIKPEVYESLHPEDIKDLEGILSHPESIISKIRSSGGRIGIAHNEKYTKEGRTVYMRLRENIKVDGSEIGVLKIKGCLPRIESGDTNTVSPYSGEAGKVKRVMEVYPNGALLLKDPCKTPAGTLFYDEAINEYEVMEKFKASPCEVDTAIGAGRYREIRFLNKPVGYVISGMKYDDARLAYCHDSGEFAGKIVPETKVTGKRHAVRGVQIEGLYRGLGKSLRYFHDSGFSHRYPHRGNIGVIQKEDGTLRGVIRDLDTTVRTFGLPLPQVVGNRFLDVSRILHDLFSSHDHYVEYDDELGVMSVSFDRAAYAFMEGYFHDLGLSQREIRGIVKKKTSFVGKIASLAGVRGYERIDYQELDEDNPVLGELIRHLREAEEVVIKKRRKKTEISSFGFQERIAREINTLNKEIGPLARGGGEYVYHVVDSRLIPEEQLRLTTPINVITRPGHFREKIVICDRGVSVEEAIGKILHEHQEKYPEDAGDVLVYAAVPDIETQQVLADRGVLSAVFVPGDEYSNFRHIEGIVAVLRAVMREDRPMLKRLYRLITGNAYDGDLPSDMRALLNKMIFDLPPVNIFDPSELRQLNNAMLEFMRSA